MDSIKIYYVFIVILPSIVMWFMTTYLILSRKKKAVIAMKEQVSMHRKLYLKECGSKNEKIAKRMLDTSSFLYEETKREYNNTRSRPEYRISGYLLGFRFLSD